MRFAQNHGIPVCILNETITKQNDFRYLAFRVWKFFYHHISTLIRRRRQYLSQKQNSFVSFLICFKMYRIQNKSCAPSSGMISSFHYKSINLGTKQNNNKIVNEVIYSMIRIMLSSNNDYSKIVSMHNKNGVEFVSNRSLTTLDQWLQLSKNISSKIANINCAFSFNSLSFSLSVEILVCAVWFKLFESLCMHLNLINSNGFIFSISQLHSFVNNPL